MVHTRMLIVYFIYIISFYHCLCRVSDFSKVSIDLEKLKKPLSKNSNARRFISDF